MARAPQILGSDTLKLAYPKLNMAIDNSNEALDKAVMAETNANQALSQSESTQTQLDTLIINSGTSDAETLQARVDPNGHAFSTLKDRLDSEFIEVTTDLGQRMINVRQPPYNVTLDGTDESSKIQQAIDDLNSTGGGILFLPIGVYRISQIRPRSNTIIEGAGKGVTVIKGVGTTDTSSSIIIYAATEAKNITIRNLTIDGDKENRTSLINTAAHSISLPYVVGFEIRNIEVKNSTGASINLYSSEEGIVENCTILNSGSNGILGLRACKSIRILNNYIDTTDNQNCIFFMYQSGFSASDIIIEGNTVKNAADFGIEVGDHVAEGYAPHQNIHIRNNYVENPKNNGISFRSVSHGTIEGNVISGYGRNGGYGCDGIFVEGENNLCSDVKIQNNTIVQTNFTGTANGIYVTGMEEVRVEGNTITGSRGHGIALIASSLTSPTTDFPDGRRVVNKIKVTNNQINKNTGSGIRVQAYNGKQIDIMGNTANDNGSKGIEIVNLNSGKDFIISNNNLKGNGKSGIQIYLCSCSINNNNIANNGKSGTATDDKAGILITGPGTFALNTNTFEDDQATATQTYYLSIHDAGTLYEIGSIKKGGSTALYEVSVVAHKKIDFA